MTYRKSRKGAALLISMIVLAILSAWAVSICSMSGTGVQLAENQRKANRARASAEAGFEIIRFWLNRIMIPETTPSSQRFSEIASLLQADLTTNGISNITTNYNGSSIIIPSVTLDSANGRSFSAQINADDPLDAEILQVDITGEYRTIKRTIRADFTLTPVKHPIFDFGIATKGPLQFDGNPELSGVNFDCESDIYIESQNQALALLINGNADIAGDISIANPDAYITIEGNASIGGETDQAAIDNHVFIGVDSIEFPVPDTGHFSQYATGDSVDASTDLTNDVTLTNARVLAGTNPDFQGNVTINGIIFIESPNIVRFAGNATINGLIVADGNIANSGTNSLTFSGNINTYPVPAGPQFDALRQETGSAILAPGFEAIFEGNSCTLDGAMAISGATFRGNANGVIKGTIINYAESATKVEGNANFRFDRATAVEVPAGFEANLKPEYDPSSYSEVGF